MTIDSRDPTRVADAFSMKPLMFETFACALAMMSFVALIGPISRTPERLIRIGRAVLAAIWR